MLACRAMPCGLWCMPVCPKAGPLPSAVMGRCGWPMLPAGVWPSPKTKKGPPLRASSSTLRSRASSSTSAARRHCRSGGGGVGGGPTRGFTVRNPVALVRLPATSLPSAPLHSRPPASPLVRCRRGDGMQQPHAQTVASAAGITSVQIQKNRILGSNSKPFTGIILKKPQQVGPLPLHVRGSIASSPQKLFSPKAAAPKSGDSIRIAVLGASGYTGAEIVRFLANHPQFHIKVMTADRKAGEQFGSVFPHLRTLDLPKLVAIKDADFSDIDAVFCCLPHGTTQEIIKSLPRHLKIVDLSADFRLRDINEYAEWYGHSHRAPELQEEAVYGLTELQRDDIRNARLVANPGCYPTSIQLPLVPLVKAKLIKLTNIIIDAKSGVSGAGRGAKEANLYTEIAEGIHAYGITSHRHVPEIEQGLTDAAESKVTISFTPHLMCMKRGMQSTIYVELASGVTPRDLYEHLKYTYEDEEFVKLLHGSSAPHTSHVVGSNYCFMNVYEDRIPGRAIIISVIDNLVKGASGQALQNLNLMMGLPENMGLQYLPLFP